MQYRVDLIYICWLSPSYHGPINHVKDFIRAISYYPFIAQIHVISNVDVVAGNKVNKKINIKNHIINKKSYILFQVISLYTLLSINMKNSFVYCRYCSFMFLPVVLKVLFSNRIFLEVNGVPNQVFLEKNEVKISVYLRKLLLFYYDKILFRSVNYIFTVCHNFKNNILKHYGKTSEVIVIPNGIFIEDIQIKCKNTAKNKLKLDLDRSYCIYVGSLSYYEGVAFLVDCFSHLNSLYKEKSPVLLFVGNGPLFEQISGRVSDEGLKNIRLLGHLPRDLMRDYIFGSDIGLYSPSEIAYSDDKQRGGSALKIIDYLSCGLPILVPRSNYYEYVIDNEIGGDFENGNVESFCTELDSLLSNKGSLSIFGANARRYAEKCLDWNYTLKNLYDILIQNLR